MALNPLLKKLVKQSAAVRREAFMHSVICDCGCEETPAKMLRDPGADIGMADVADRWVEQIIESDDPDTEFEQLINHLLGVLANVELVRKHYAEFSKQAA